MGLVIIIYGGFLNMEIINVSGDNFYYTESINKRCMIIYYILTDTVQSPIGDVQLTWNETTDINDYAEANLNDNPTRAILTWGDIYSSTQSDIQPAYNCQHKVYFYNHSNKSLNITFTFNSKIRKMWKETIL